MAIDEGSASLLLTKISSDPARVLVKQTNLLVNSVGLMVHGGQLTFVNKSGLYYFFYNFIGKDQYENRHKLEQ